MKNIYLILFTVLLGAGAAVLLSVYTNQTELAVVDIPAYRETENEIEVPTTTPELPNVQEPEDEDPSQEAPPITGVLYQQVPFTAQAPFGDWDDPRQQNACEEASVLMAVHWAWGSTFNLEQARDEIIKISDWEESTYGVYEDTSVQDTVDRIFRAYFDFHNVRIEDEVNAEDIKEELARGHLVVVPVNGQKIGNPYFTPPGPIQHMLVVIGYDPETDEFITNDPGTRQGKDFRYHTSVLEDALQEYPTGYHEPITEINKKMIVVSKEM